MENFIVALCEQLEEVRFIAFISPLYACTIHEQEKKEISSHPAMRSAKASLAFCLEFASRVFLTADDEDRSGQATKKTAKMFLVASHFMDVAQGFASSGGEEGENVLEIPMEVAERARYARWKAADIVKAINEGRQPIPGPPPTERRGSLEKEECDTSKSPLQQETPAMPDDGVASRRPSTVQSFGGSELAIQHPNTSHSSLPLTQSSTFSPSVRTTTLDRSGFATAQSTSATSPTMSTSSMHAMMDRAKILGESEKYCRYGLSSIQFEDISAAVENLQHALNLLKRLT